MSKVTIIIGEPATGKSTIVKRLITNYGPWFYDGRTKYVPNHSSGKRCIIGRYDDLSHQFPGTDRMSMACQQYVLKFMGSHPEMNYVIEGDRLSTQSFLWGLKHEGYDLVVLRVWLRQELLDARRKVERTQSEKFIKSRVTKIQNLMSFCAQENIPLISIEHLDANTTNIIANDLHSDRLS